MRKYAVLSITTLPAATAAEANLALTLPPAENKATSIPSKESSSSTSTLTRFPLNGKNCPADRSEARKRNSPTGNKRSSNISRICSPTAPVTPTTATLYFSFFTIDYPFIASIFSRTNRPISLHPTDRQSFS